MNFRTLKASEIDVRVGNVQKNGYTLLLYKDARCDMNILDETVGAENWQRDHKEIKGNLYCGVGIWDEKKSQWVWKWDCGTESNTEKEKGEASDSFKRACVNLGIGRELYTSPVIKVFCETIEEKFGNKITYKLPNTEKFRKFKVTEIAYNNNREISKLVIVDENGVRVYPSTKATPKPAPKIDDKIELVNKYLCENCGCEITEKVAKFSQDKFGKELCINCQYNGHVNTKSFVKDRENLDG